MYTLVSHGKTTISHAPSFFVMSLIGEIGSDGLPLT